MVVPRDEAYIPDDCPSCTVLDGVLEELVYVRSFTVRPARGLAKVLPVLQLIENVFQLKVANI